MSALTVTETARDGAQDEFRARYALFVSLSDREDDEAIVLRATLARRLRELAPLVGLMPGQVTDLNAACKLIEDMASSLQTVTLLEARLAELGPSFAASDDQDSAADKALTAEFRRLERRVSHVQKRTSKSLRTFVRSRSGCSRQHLRGLRRCLMRGRARRSLPRRSSHAGGARGSGSSNGDGDGDGPPEPPPHPAKVFGPDEPRRQPPSDGYHRPRTFAGRNLATTRVLVDGGRELP
jgi:hypothetical protein